MVSHKLRLLVIAVSALVALVSLVVLVALDKAEGTGFGAVAAAASLLIPAFLDALGAKKTMNALEEKKPRD